MSRTPGPLTVDARANSNRALHQSQRFLQATLPSSHVEHPLVTVSEAAKEAKAQLEIDIAAIKQRYRMQELSRKYNVNNAFGDTASTSTSTFRDHPYLATPQYQAAQAVLNMFGPNPRSGNISQHGLDHSDTVSQEGTDGGIIPSDHVLFGGDDIHRTEEEEEGGAGEEGEDEEEERREHVYEGEEEEAADDEIQEVTMTAEHTGDQDAWRVGSDEEGEDEDGSLLGLGGYEEPAMQDQDDDLEDYEFNNTIPPIYVQSPTPSVQLSDNITQQNTTANTPQDEENVVSIDPSLSTGIDNPPPHDAYNVAPFPQMEMPAFGSFSGNDLPLDMRSGADASWLTDFINSGAVHNLQEQFIQGGHDLYGNQITYPPPQHYSPIPTSNPAIDPSLDAYSSTTNFDGFNTFANMPSTTEGQLHFSSMPLTSMNPLSMLAAAAFGDTFADQPLPPAMPQLSESGHVTALHDGPEQWGESSTHGYASQAHSPPSGDTSGVVPDATQDYAFPSSNGCTTLPPVESAPIEPGDSHQDISAVTAETTQEILVDDDIVIIARLPTEETPVEEIPNNGLPEEQMSAEPVQFEDESAKEIPAATLPATETHAGEMGTEETEAEMRTEEMNSALSTNEDTPAEDVSAVSTVTEELPAVALTEEVSSTEEAIVSSTAAGEPAVTVLLDEDMESPVLPREEPSISEGIFEESEVGEPANDERNRDDLVEVTTIAEGHIHEVALAQKSTTNTEGEELAIPEDKSMTFDAVQSPLHIDSGNELPNLEESAELSIVVEYQDAELTTVAKSTTASSDEQPSEPVDNSAMTSTPSHTEQNDAGLSPSLRIPITSDDGAVSTAASIPVLSDPGLTEAARLAMEGDLLTVQGADSHAVDATPIPQAAEVRTDVEPTFLGHDEGQNDGTLSVQKATEQLPPMESDPPFAPEGPRLTATVDTAGVEAERGPQPEEQADEVQIETGVEDDDTVEGILMTLDTDDEMSEVDEELGGEEEEEEEEEEGVALTSTPTQSQSMILAEGTSGSAGLDTTMSELADDEDEISLVSDLIPLWSQESSPAPTPVPLLESRGGTPFSDLFSGEYDLEADHPELETAAKDPFEGLKLPRKKGYFAEQARLGQETLDGGRAREASATSSGELEDMSGEGAAGGLTIPSELASTSQATSTTVGDIMGAYAQNGLEEASIEKVDELVHEGNRSDLDTDVTEPVAPKTRLTVGAGELSNVEKLLPTEPFRPEEEPSPSKNPLQDAVPESKPRPETADDSGLTGENAVHLLEGSKTAALTERDIPIEATPEQPHEPPPALVSGLPSQDLDEPMEDYGLADLFDIVPHNHGSPSPPAAGPVVRQRRSRLSLPVDHVPLTRKNCHWEKVRVAVDGQPTRTFFVTICSINEAQDVDGVTREGYPRVGEFDQALQEIPPLIAESMPEALARLQAYIGASPLGAARWLPVSAEEIEEVHAQTVARSELGRKASKRARTEDDDDAAGVEPKWKRQRTPSSEGPSTPAKRGSERKSASSRKSYKRARTDDREIAESVDQEALREETPSIALPEVEDAEMMDASGPPFKPVDSVEDSASKAIRGEPSGRRLRSSGVLSTLDNNASEMSEGMVQIPSPADVDEMHQHKSERQHTPSSQSSSARSPSKSPSTDRRTRHRKGASLDETKTPPRELPDAGPSNSSPSTMHSSPTSGRYPLRNHPKVEHEEWEKEHDPAPAEAPRAGSKRKQQDEEETPAGDSTTNDLTEYHASGRPKRQRTRT